MIPGSALGGIALNSRGGLSVVREEWCDEQVEDAMFETLHLQKEPFDLPDSFFTVASGFKPKLPLRAEDKKEKKD